MSQPVEVRTCPICLFGWETSFPAEYLEAARLTHVGTYHTVAELLAACDELTMRTPTTLTLPELMREVGREVLEENRP